MQITRNLVDLVGPSGALEKAMAPHSSTFAWKIPWTEAAVHGIARVGHD